MSSSSCIRACMFVGFCVGRGYWVDGKRHGQDSLKTNSIVGQEGEQWPRQLGADSADRIKGLRC
jgi:hypothetical protein